MCEVVISQSLLVELVVRRALAVHHAVQSRVHVDGQARAAVLAVAVAGLFHLGVVDVVLLNLRDWPCTSISARVQTFWQLMTGDLALASAGEEQQCWGQTRR